MNDNFHIKILDLKIYQEKYIIYKLLKYTLLNIKILKKIFIFVLNKIQFRINKKDVFN